MTQTLGHRRVRLPLLLFALAFCVPATEAASKAPRTTVYKVPTSIADDCSGAVESEIMAWLDTVPDGSTVQFGAGRCYGQDNTITLTDRKGLVIDGQGSEFRALTPGEKHRANWRFVRGSDLTVRNMAVRGSNPDGLYDHAIERQHGYSVEGVQGMTLSNVKARETWGDGVYLDEGGPTPPAATTPRARATSSSPGRCSSGSAGREWPWWTPSG